MLVALVLTFLKKFLNKNLNKFSLNTVNDFFKDASSAGFNILEKDS